MDLEHADQLVLLAQPDDPRDLGRVAPARYPLCITPRIVLAPKDLMFAHVLVWLW